MIGMTITVGILCIFSFTIGAIIGQKTVKKEDIRLPNPVRMVREIEDSFEQRKERERNRIIAENIDNYDGTSIGQKDVPK